MNNLKLLLHVCCAPCSGGIIEILLEEKVFPTLFFYNPNIYPFEEYNRRKQEILLFAHKKAIPWVDIDHEQDAWFKRIKGLENQQERGPRCQACFDIRLERAALYAHEHGFNVVATTNGISRWKDLSQVNSAGLRAVKHYPGLIFWDRDWRKNDGAARMLQVRNTEKFYQQDYCGCLFSLMASKQRKKNKTL